MFLKHSDTFFRTCLMVSSHLSWSKRLCEGALLASSTLFTVLAFFFFFFSLLSSAFVALGSAFCSFCKRCVRESDNETSVSNALARAERLCVVSYGVCVCVRERGGTSVVRFLFFDCSVLGSCCSSFLSLPFSTAESDFCKEDPKGV